MSIKKLLFLFEKNIFDPSVEKMGWIRYRPGSRILINRRGQKNFLGDRKVVFQESQLLAAHFEFRNTAGFRKPGFNCLPVFL